jgi:hypothetical protein
LSSGIEILIPGSQEDVHVLLNGSFDFHELWSGESLASLKSYGIEPQLCDRLVTLYVYVRRLSAITCIKKESIWADPKCCRYLERI